MLENSCFSMHNRLLFLTQTSTLVDSSAKLHNTLFLIIFESANSGLQPTVIYVPLLYALFSTLSCVFGPANDAVF